ncbi:MAG: AAA family ATPase [Candidatus Lokiarchaeota archaeon]|nr:AAA family ATPase [Candidatus Lokiarchaeota archaeon]MBD3199807.1 AAA family ATPase [Candidatus Lokiarchaeota archaeon]
MVKAIYLCSLRERVGKTLISIGLIQKLKKDGYKVGYFKPIGTPKGAFTNKADPDISFVMGCVEPDDMLEYNQISPVSIPDCYYVDLIDSERKEEYQKRIRESYIETTKNLDYVIIEGAQSIKKYIRVGVDDLSIACVLGIDELVFIETESSDKCIDNLFFTKNYFDYRESKIKGVIFNKIDHDYLARIKELEKNHINRYGIPILGIVGKSLELMSPRVSEIQAALGASLLNESAADALENRAETYIIGAMGPQAALKYLRQVKQAAVITGGDRVDLALTALNQDVSVLILTGFIKPDTSVITAANEKNVPILLSPSDTYTTLRNMERIRPGIQQDEIKKVLDLVEKTIDWELLLK